MPKTCLAFPEYLPQKIPVIQSLQDGEIILDQEQLATKMKIK